MEKDPSTGDHPSKSHMSTVLCVLWTFVFLLLAVAGVAVYGISQGWLGQLPPVSELENPINKYASRVYTADNQLLGTWSYSRANRIFVDYRTL